MMLRAFPFILLFLLLAGGGASEEVTRKRLALRELVERANAGDPKSLYDLASLHDRGYDSIPIDSSRSTALYRLSAAKGYSRAENYLGFRYFKGEFVEQNIDSALFWITKAADDGNIAAANNLGYLFTESDVVPRDYQRGVYWLTKAADAGLPQAESQLADLYRHGLGVTPDTAFAVALYNRAIDKGLHDAELKLMSMMEKNWEKLSADSAVALGRYYYTHRAPMAGVMLFENAAKNNNPAALALLGDAYSKGKGIDYNHAESIKFYLRAAELGNPSAQFIIAELLDIFPDALPDSVPPASYWYEQAASSGIRDADSAFRVLIQDKAAGD